MITVEKQASEHIEVEIEMLKNCRPRNIDQFFGAELFEDSTWHITMEALEHKVH